MSKHNRERRRQRRRGYAQVIKEATDKAMADGTLKPGQVYTINLAHDGWCRMMSGGKRCTCSPVVRSIDRVPSPEEN